MAPTFKDGDILLVRIFKERPKNLQLLQIVLVERELQPGIHYIKRIQKIHGDGYWVEGDNRDTEIQKLMSDSRTWGYLNTLVKLTVSSRRYQFKSNHQRTQSLQRTMVTAEQTATNAPYPMVF